MTAVQNKVCVVTGAGSGIGRALSGELARRGARLALSDVDEAGLARTAAALDGADVHTAPLDVADRDAFTAYAEAVAGHFGVVHQIYNNAGIAHNRDVADSEWEDWERVLGINLWGVLHGTKLFLPHLIASGDGHVINVSSLNGIFAQPGMSHYCIAKFGVRGLTESLRAELLLAKHPVRTTVVHPGGIKTNIASAALEHARGTTTAVTEAEERRTQTYNAKLLKMDPAQAARIIVDGVEKNRPRVMVGNDAKAIDFLVRLVPGLAPRIAAAAEKRMHG